MSEKKLMDDGFTLTEALAALLVLSLALSQAPTLIARFSGSLSQSARDVEASRDATSRSREVDRDWKANDDAAGTQPGDKRVAQEQLQYHHPCQFDVVGRRCL